MAAGLLERHVAGEQLTERELGHLDILCRATDGTVLTVAYMDAEALRRTLESGRSWFYSRSRQEYWQKGETSGDRQYVREVRVEPGEHAYAPGAGCPETEFDPAADAKPGAIGHSPAGRGWRSLVAQSEEDARWLAVAADGLDRVGVPGRT